MLVTFFHALLHYLMLFFDYTIHDKASESLNFFFSLFGDSEGEARQIMDKLMDELTHLSNTDPFTMTVAQVMSRDHLIRQLTDLYTTSTDTAFDLAEEAVRAAALQARTARRANGIPPVDAVVAQIGGSSSMSGMSGTPLSTPSIRDVRQFHDHVSPINNDSTAPTNDDSTVPTV